MQRFEVRARITKVSGILFLPDVLYQFRQLVGGGEFHPLGFVPSHEDGQLSAGIQLGYHFHPFSDHDSSDFLAVVFLNKRAGAVEVTARRLDHGNQPLGQLLTGRLCGLL